MMHPSPGLALPFALLLALIALAPLWFPSWWSRHYGKVAAGLGLLVLGFYLTYHAYDRVLHTAEEYISFICLVGSLFVVSGGIHINVKGEATPAVNVLF